MFDKLPLVLYGAGKNALDSIELLKAYGVHPVCFCDLDVNKQGSTVHGLPVYDMVGVKQKYGKFIIYITVMSSRIREEILSYLFDEEIEDILVQTGEGFIYAKIKDSGVHSADRLGRYKLYVRDKEEIEYYCSKNYLCEQELYVKSIDNGIILPAKEFHESAYPYWVKAGGVVDADCNFIDGHSSNKSAMKTSKEVIHTVMFSYNVSKALVYIDETVVYGGCFINHYGHFFLEGLNRMWWFLKNPNKKYKYAFTGFNGNELNIKYIELLLLMGLKKEDIIVVSQPTQFERVIVPEQAHYLQGSYSNETLMVYNKIRDSVPPSNIKKLYLTKSKLGSKATLNEEYFENYYKSKGFEIVFPDDYPIPEQISLLAGAEEIVCCNGTLHQCILFCQDNISVTVFNTFACIIPTCAWVNQARNAKCTLIDVCLDFLYRNKLTLTPILLLPTIHWKEYLEGQGDKDYPCDADLVLKEFALEFILRFAKDIQNNPHTVQPCFENYSLADFVIDVHSELLDEKLEEGNKKILYKWFPRKK